MTEAKIARVRAPSVAGTALLAAALVILSPLTLAMYGPSMPAMVAAFGVTRGEIQLTLTVYLVAFALAQLVYGPLNDRFGRRPVAIGGLLVYLLGCLVGGLAGSIEQMLVARVLEGVGACAGSASSRAFVRDRFDGAAATRVFSLTGIALAVAPAAGPLIAGYLQRDHGWQSIFVALGAAAAMLLLLLWFAMPETLARQDRRALAPRSVLASYGKILATRSFLGAALVLALVSAGTYYYVALAPFVLIQQLGLGPERFGQLIPLTMLGYFLASSAAAAVVGRVSPSRLLAAGLACSLAAALGLFLLLHFDAASVESVLAALVLWMVGNALIAPVTTATALSAFAAQAGRAAAVLGFAQMLGSGLGALAQAVTSDAWRGLAPVLLVLAAGLLLLALAPRLSTPPAG